MSESEASVRLVIITGLSGAGRRTASHALEDLEWFVVDNLPPTLLPALVDVCRVRGIGKLAVVLDVRSGAEFEQLPAAFSQLRESGIRPEVLFVEARDDVIVRRQESVRRPLPLQGRGRLVDAIRRERQLLADLRAGADLVIDTTSINIHQLSARVATAFGADEESARLRITLMSFGFKRGIPLDADLVLDVRFLPNPYWVLALRPQTGLAQPVADYVMSQADAEPFLEHTVGLIELVAPGYLREGKRHATVAIGCTGGKHRSTAITEELSRRLESRGLPVGVYHRDLGLE